MPPSGGFFPLPEARALEKVKCMGKSTCVLTDLSNMNVLWSLQYKEDKIHGKDSTRGGR